MIIGQKQWGKLIKLHDSIYIGVWEGWYPVPQYRRVPLLEQDTQPSLEVGDCLGLVLTGVPCKGRSQFLHFPLGRGIMHIQANGTETNTSKANGRKIVPCPTNLPEIGFIQGEKKCVESSQMSIPKMFSRITSPFHSLMSHEGMF